MRRKGKKIRSKSRSAFPVFLIVLPYTLQNYLLLLPLLIMLQDSRVGRFITLSCVFFLGPFLRTGILGKGILQKHSQAASSFFRYHRDLFFFEPDNPAGSALRPSAACSYGLIGYIGAFTAGLVTNRLFPCLFPFA